MDDTDQLDVLYNHAISDSYTNHQEFALRDGVWVEVASTYVAAKPKRKRAKPEKPSSPSGRGRPVGCVPNPVSGAMLREVISLIGMTGPEAAKISGVNVNTVYSIWRKHNLSKG